MATKADTESAQIQRKAAVIDDIKQRLEASDAAVLTEYRGLTVPQIAELRAALRPASTDYKVFKNTLARRAASAAGLTEVAVLLEGPVAIAFVRRDGDPVIAAKALRDFARTHPSLIVKGGVFGERVLSVGDVEALADVPPRDQLLARLAGGFQAPLVKAAGLFQAFTRNMAYGVKALIDQRIEGGEALPVETVETVETVRRAGRGDGRGRAGRGGRRETAEDAPAPETVEDAPAPETTEDAPAAETTEEPAAAAPGDDADAPTE